MSTTCWHCHGAPLRADPGALVCEACDSTFGLVAVTPKQVNTPTPRHAPTLTELAYFETAVYSTSKAAPNWAAFSRWLSAGAGTIVAAALSNLVALDVSSSYFSAGGVALAIASLIPALGIEWLYLFLQPMGDAMKQGEQMSEKYGAGSIDHELLGKLVLDQAPWLIRWKLQRFMRPIDPRGIADYVFRLSRQGRRLVIEQMALLAIGVSLVAGPKLWEWLKVGESIARFFG